MQFATDFGKVTIDFDPENYLSAAGAAKAFHAALIKLEKSTGGSGNDIVLHTPEKTFEMLGYKAWRVIWEGGPYEWGITASLELALAHTGWWTEPYYSFDLCFLNN